MEISDTDRIKLNTEKESPIKTKPEIKSNIKERGSITSKTEASCLDSWKDHKSKKRKSIRNKKRLKNKAENVQPPVPVPKTKQVNVFQDRNTNYADVGAFPHFIHHGGGFQLPRYNPIIYQPSPYPPYPATIGVHVINSSFG